MRHGEEATGGAKDFCTRAPQNADCVKQIADALRERAAGGGDPMAALVVEVSDEARDRCALRHATKGGARPVPLWLLGIGLVVMGAQTLMGAR